jgi:hypothetical protein
VLECADCRSRVSDEASRCPRCGSRRLLAPPLLLTRRGVLAGVYGGGFLLFGLWLAAAFGVQFLAFFDRALAAFGLSPAQIGAAERRQRLRDAVRDAELTLPAYPGATRLKEWSTENRVDTAPVVESCWAAPGTLEEVLAHFRQALSGPGSTWRTRRDSPASGQLGAEAGQVRLLVRGPGPGLASGQACPPETTYVLSFTAFAGQV